TAFFEAYGAPGWEAMHKLANYLPSDVIKIADAKRGDIGNSSRMYVRAFFEQMNFDAITVNPYLGYDSVQPFLQDAQKGVFILCHTSNHGAADFQKFGDEKLKLFESVALKVAEWNVNNNCCLVVGATYPREIAQLRKLAPSLPFLIPGLGAQGGDFALAVKHALTWQNDGAIFNFSRSIIYASPADDFADAAGLEARQMKEQLNQFRTQP
ncbi:MAG: orotidine-5'-phosphate decarboxylase, partial [bacterium]|nr:orotidine-5'-phosphate decarboxylase [bacterium]